MYKEYINIALYALWPWYQVVSIFKLLFPPDRLLFLPLMTHFTSNNDFSKSLSHFIFIKQNRFLLVSAL